MLLHILGEIEIVIFLWGILQMKFSRKRTSYFWAIVFFVCGELFYQFCVNEDAGFLIGRVLGCMLGTCALFSGKFAKKLVRYWFSVFYISIFYIPFELLRRLFGGQGGDVFISICTCVLVFLFGLWIKRKPEWIAWIVSIPSGYYILGFVCSFCDSFMRAIVGNMGVMWSLREQIFVGILQMIVSIFLYTLCIAVAFTDLWRRQYKEEGLLKDEYLRMSAEHYEELANHMREVRGIRHDIAAHMNMLETYMQKEQWEKARNYLGQMREHQRDRYGMRIEVGNELVNAVIADKLAKYKGTVQLVCEGVLPKRLEVTDYDLCTIFSNLLSNAADACGKLRVQEKRIFLQIKTFRENLVIVIENPIEWEVETKKLENRVCRLEESCHGYGLFNIRKSLDAYGGEMELCAENGSFQVRLLLYHVIKDD